jgi:hypothetical protein
MFLPAIIAIQIFALGADPFGLPELLRARVAILRAAPDARNVVEFSVAAFRSGHHHAITTPATFTCFAA